MQVFLLATRVFLSIIFSVVVFFEFQAFAAISKKFDFESLRT
jgi:hypothetical protein